MKNPERVIWTLLALGAFVAGSGSHFSLFAPDPADPATGHSPGGTAVHATDNHVARTDGQMTPPERAVLVERTALASPLRTGRFMGMAAALDQVKPDTWQDMWNEFKRQTTEDGRVHELEWSLFMNRVGEIDGPAAMAFFEKNGQPEYTFNRGAVLSGWAAVAPEAAIAWMESQPADSPNQQLQSTLLAGVVQANPELALSLLAKAPGNRGASMAREFVSDLIQAKGIQFAMDRVTTLRTAGGSVPAYAEVMDREITERVGRMSWLAGDEAAITAWQEKRRGAAVTTPPPETSEEENR